MACSFINLDWIDLVQNTDQWRASVNMVKEPSGSVQFWEFV
jgi:hypothetical protein